MTEEQTKKDFGTLFKDADSPSTVRRKEDDILLAMAEKQRQARDDSALLTQLFLGLGAVTIITVYGWCNLFPFYPCIEEPHLTSIEAIVKIILRFNLFLLWIYDGLIWVLEQNVFLLQKALQFSSPSDFGHWLMTSYIPRLGDALIGLVIVNVLTFIAFGVAWALMLMCVAKTCCFCKRVEGQGEAEEQKREGKE
jgi:hypothetical protein